MKRVDKSFITDIRLQYSIKNKNCPFLTDFKIMHVGWLIIFIWFNIG